MACSTKIEKNSFIKVSVGLSVFVCIVVLIYATAVEPYRIEVTHHTVKTRINKQLKIAHLSDIHTKGFGKREVRFLQILDDVKPDIILVTGDTIVSGGDYKSCFDILSRLKAPMGVYVVRGNWENWFPVGDERNYYKSAGVQFLLNHTKEIVKGVWIVGLDDPWTGEPKLDEIFKSIPETDLRLAIFHSPVAFDELAGKIDFAFAGHTHGGQIALPFIGPIWLPGGCGRYIKGWYQNKNSRMYVSRGIGTSIISMRFLSRPEVAIVSLVPE